MIGDNLHPLTSAQVDSLKKTFKVLDVDRFAMRFYTSLFTRYPEVKSLFPSDLTELATKIVGVLQLVVYSFRESMPGEFQLQPDVIEPLKGLGHLHLKKGVQHEHYPNVNEVLLDALREELHNNFNSETELAWKLALNHLSYTMLCGAKEKSETNHPTMRDSYHHIRSLLFKI